MVIDAEGTWDLVKGVPVTLWMLFSVILLSAVSPTGAVHEFSAHRMQQFDLYGTQYGSRSALVNMEARGELASMLNRKCVIVKWAQLSLESFIGLIERGAGSILVLLPPDISSVNEELIEEWRILEAELAAMRVDIPVYFAIDDDELSLIHTRLEDNAKKESQSSALSRLLSVFTEDGYQMISGNQQESQPDKTVQIHTITGKLVGAGVEHKLPTLAILAHYDITGLAPSIPSHTGGSGVAALIEMVRLFSRLYADPKQRPKYNLLFILSGGGKLNYFGVKHLILELLNYNQDENGLLLKADYTLCLDEIAFGDGLFVHVSKPPKEDTIPNKLLSALNETWSCLHHDSSLQLVHKKVRLGDELLAWEHEQFSLKRLSAATISSLDNHNDLRRTSMFVSSSENDMDILSHNVDIITNGIAKLLYGLSCENSTDCSQVFDGGLNTEYLRAWKEYLSNNKRSSYLLGHDHPVVIGLEQVLNRYVQDVQIHSHKPESMDPEFVAYDILDAKLQAHRIKPALFDLFLGLTIAVYGAMWYFSVLFFPVMWPVIETIPFPMQVRTFRPAKID